MSSNRYSLGQIDTAKTLRGIAVSLSYHEQWVSDLQTYSDPAMQNTIMLNNAGQVVPHQHTYFEKHREMMIQRVVRGMIASKSYDIVIEFIQRHLLRVTEVAKCALDGEDYIFAEKLTIDYNADSSELSAYAYNNSHLDHY